VTQEAGSRLAEMYEALEEDGEDGGAAQHVERGNGGPNAAPPLANLDAGIGEGIGGGGGGGVQKEGQSSDEEEYWECSLCLQPIVTNIWQVIFVGLIATPSPFSLP
jgi:hypothetical protein